MQTWQDMLSRIPYSFTLYPKLVKGPELHILVGPPALDQFLEPNIQTKIHVSKKLKVKCQLRVFRIQHSQWKYGIVDAREISVNPPEGIV